MSCLMAGTKLGWEESILTCLFSAEPRTFKAKELWEKNGAVIMAVRRPGCFLCREVSTSRICTEKRILASGANAFLARTKGL